LHTGEFNGVPTALVFAGAPLSLSARVQARLAELTEAFVVAADSGAATALAFGYVPDVVVGDFDSLPPATLAELERRGVAIERHPADKDATDGQLAIERALLTTPSALWLVGFLGGPRLDQALASVLQLVTLDVPTTLFDEHNECTLLRPGRGHAWLAEPGEVISLIPLGDDVEGVTTHGLRWPLTNARLRVGDARGVSTEPVSTHVRVSIASGCLLLTRHFPLSPRV
jgi:thiamine pyrophosphokinase